MNHIQEKQFIKDDRRQGITLNPKESEVVNMAVAVYVGQVRNILPVNNRAWKVIAGITRKLENRKMYNSGYNDFALELELLQALQQQDQEKKEIAERVEQTIAWERDILAMPCYNGMNKYV